MKFNPFDPNASIAAREMRHEPKVEHDRSPVVVQGEPLNEIWWQGRQWAVTSYGIEQRNGCYAIPVSDLGMHAEGVWSWPEHLAEKGWTDVEDFTTAWLIAITLHGQAGEKCLEVICKLPPIGGEY